MAKKSKKKLLYTNDPGEVRKRILHQFSPATLLQQIAADCIVDCWLRLQTELSSRAKSREQEADDPRSGAPTVSPYLLWDNASIRNAIRFLSDLLCDCDKYPKLSEEKKEQIRKAFGEEFVAELTAWPVESWDACLLAHHLITHARTFGSPLPPIAETAPKVLRDSKLMKEMMLKLLRQKTCHLQELLQFNDSRQHGLRALSSGRMSGSLSSAPQDLQKAVVLEASQHITECWRRRMIRKSVTDKVIAANRRNAKCSTGPKNVAAVKNNALKHGLLARAITFENKEDEREFSELLESIQDDFPRAIQNMVQQELATCWWKSQMAEQELRDIRRQPNTSAQILRNLISLNNDDAASVFSGVRGPDIASTTDLSGWEGRELVLKAGKSNGDSSVLPENLDDENGSSVIELRLTNSTERILRYQASLKRDFYRALQTLINLKCDTSANDIICGSKKASED